ncbi:hypothetical protein ES708_28274 [subsurface metagenome]
MSDQGHIGLPVSYVIKGVFGEDTRIQDEQSTSLAGHTGTEGPGPDRFSHGGGRRYSLGDLKLPSAGHDLQLQLS